MATRTKSKPAKKPTNGKQKKPAARPPKAAAGKRKAASPSRKQASVSVKGVVRAITGGKGRSGGKAKR